MFHHAFIPRRLDEVSHFERDAARIAAGGNTEGIYYQTVTGLEADLSGVRTVPAVLQAAAAAAAEGEGVVAGTLSSSGDTEDSSSSDGDSSDEGEPSGAWEDRAAAPDREAVRTARKANKEAVKEAKREQRKVKMPKHLKKKRVKNTSGKK